MTFWLQTDLWILSSPERAFARIAHSPSIGAAVVLLVIISLLFLASQFLSSAMRYQRKRSAQQRKKDAVPVVAICSLFIPAIWFWLALLTQGLLNLLHTPSTFDTLFCLLAFAAIPQLAGWLTYPLRNFHWYAYRIWQAVMAGGLLWTSVLAGLSFHTIYGLNGWKLLLACAPLLTLLWAAGIAAARELPDSLQAARLWQRMAGERVVVFARLTTKPDELAEIVRESDATLERATQLLEVEPLAFKLGIFLFADQQEHRDILEIKTNQAEGYAHGDCLTSAVASWEQLQGIIPHEIGHVLREQRITSKAVAFLDEGLAVYVNAKLFPQKTHAPLISVPHTLHVLAHYYIFYNWLYAQQPDYSSDHYYSHAHGFVRFLIQSLGIKAFKQFMKEAGEDKSEDAGERLENAAKKVYEVSLTQLETEWREKETK